MKCARCSAEVPRQSQFCLRCGTPINAVNNYAPPVAPQGSPIPSAPANNRSMLAVIGVLVVAVLAMAAWMVKSSLAQKPGATNAPSLVQAPAQMGTGPLIQAPGASNTTPVVVAPPGQTVQQPSYAEIDDYLKFVRQVELTKQNLVHDEDRDAHVTLETLPADQVKKFLAGTDDPSPSGDPTAGKQEVADVKSRSQEIMAKWEELAKLFNTRTPPQACVELRDKYLTHLGIVEKQVAKIYDILAKVKTDPTGALQDIEGMRGASGDADDSAVSADHALADICNTYHLQKEFEIKADKSDSGSLGALMGH